VLQYTPDETLHSTEARFGQLLRANEERSPMPATAPTPRTSYEGDAILRLVKAGAPIPALIVPLSTRRQVAAQFGSFLGGPRQLTLEGTDFYPQRPITICDPETEAFTFGCDARLRIQSDSLSVPGAFEALLGCGLSADSAAKRLDAGVAWDIVRKEYGLSGLTSWFEQAEAQAKSTVFLAPSPLIRANTTSVRRAFEIGWQIADSIESPFEAVGIHLLVHAEVFRDEVPAQQSRAAILSSIQSLYRSPSPRNFPVVSLKLLDIAKSFAAGPDSSVHRRNLSEFLTRAGQEVRNAGGLFVIHNLGTWSLAALDCGADVVGFRGTGRTLDIEPIFGSHESGVKVGSGKQERRSARTNVRMHIRVQPFDPVRLCNAKISHIRAAWVKTNGFPVAKFVVPEPFWELDTYQQREYRARQVTGAILEIASEFRDASRSSIPFRDCVRDRVGRMQEQDAMFDLCPSLS
jgi:hypothetical protein